MTTATIYRPRVISIPASPYCELARWTLDRLGIPYQEEGHAPILHSFTGGQNGGSGIVSVDTGEASLRNAREVLDYYESRCLPNQKLYPAEAKVQAETRRLFDFFFETFGMATLAWAYAHMLRLRIVTVRAWTDRVPWWERLGVNIFYPLLIGSVRRNLAIEQDTISKQEQVIENAFTHVESRLADGRRFLLGDRLTAADLALAALAAPILLPVEYGGPVSKLEDLPADMRVTVEFSPWSTKCAPSGGSFRSENLRAAAKSVRLQVRVKCCKGYRS